MSVLRQIISKSSPWKVALPKICTIGSYSTEHALEKLQPETECDKLYRVLELELRGNDPAVLKSYCKFATSVGSNFNLESKTWSQRKPTHERFTVLKSVHVHKKHRVQYEFRTYFSFVQYKHLTGSTADTLLEYVQRNLPEGVAMKATKVEIQAIPEHLNPPTQ